MFYILELTHVKDAIISQYLYHVFCYGKIQCRNLMGDQGVLFKVMLSAVYYVVSFRIRVIDLMG